MLVLVSPARKACKLLEPRTMRSLNSDSLLSCFLSMDAGTISEHASISLALSGRSFFSILRKHSTSAGTDILVLRFMKVGPCLCSILYSHLCQSYVWVH